MISGYFLPAVASPTPIVQVALFLPGLSADWAIVDFLLDTGASETCLHPRDAVRQVGIAEARLMAPQLWPRQRTLGGVGGSTTYYVHPALFGFQYDDQQPRVLQGEILVAEPNASNRRVPSLLGWDVLRHFRVTLDYGQRFITLE